MSKVKNIVLQFEHEDVVIPKEMWLKNPIPASIVGEARVVVRRGALVANIPADVPFGTFCICVNLASIKSDEVPASAGATASSPERNAAGDRPPVQSKS